MKAKNEISKRAWLGIGWVVFLLGQRLHSTIQESENLQAAMQHMTLACRYMIVTLSDSLTFLINAMVTLLNWPLETGTLPFVTMSLASMLLWRKLQQPHHRHHFRCRSRSTNKTKGGGDNEDLEILRTSRDRSSTFDFFGTHTRDRNNSLTDTSHAERRESFRRERVGSMDLYYSRRDESAKIITKATAKTTKAKSKTAQPKLKRKLSFGTTPSSNAGDMPQDAYFTQQALRESEGNSSEEGYLFDEFGLVTLSYDIVYYGPTPTALLYETWTPPTSWAEISRRIIPQDIMLKLRRKLELDMNQGIITVKEPTSAGRWDISLPVNDCSVHVEPPLEGAIMSLYVKGTSKDEWMEHTFESAQAAAQFQLDLLAYQILGRTLNNMFQVLSLIHFGSEAYEGPEYVLHFNPTEAKEESSRETTSLTAVSWDDAMRALSSIPTIRIALERLWLHHRRPGDDALSSTNPKITELLPSKETSDLESRLLTELYSGKRLLLGPVDFFRLFVPALPDTALPQNDSNRPRMEQLLSWRKRAARAAVLIRTYAMARRVVNIGWHIPHVVPDQPRTLTRRLAFDDNDDNNRRDSKTRDEIYEASVSRDILCHVRPYDFFRSTTNGTNNRGLVLSPYQAYALVDIHIFRKPTHHDPNFFLTPSRDPIDAIPSLRNLIANNPDLDFFVSCYHRNDTVSVMCYARSLAKGIDSQFDNVMTRFTNGDKILRDRKVHMVIQIGQSQTISFMGMLLVRFLVFLFSLTQKGRESPMSLQARRDRIPLPAVRIASYGDTYHFGGALQQKDDLPKNYVAMSTTFTPKGMPNLIAKLMFKNLNDQMSERILDFTLVLQGEQDDELPERALCTTRMVRVDAAAVAAMPLNKDIYNLPKSAEDQQSSSLHGETFQMWTQRVASEFATAVRSNLKMPALHGNEGAIVAVPPSSTESKNPTKPPTSKNKRDTIKEAIKEVMALLADVKIPLKVGSVHAMTGPKESLSLPEGIVMMPVLDTINKDEIKRFVVSSNCDVKTISVRIVQTAAWRGRTFPIPIRSCRVELQSGQLFQQGHDLAGNPVFYFTTMCRGPWRRDVAATLSAAIHRFDTNLSEICAGKPDTRCTIVVLLGRPKGATNKTTKSSTEGSSVDSATIEEEEVGGSGTSQGSRIEGSLDAESTNMSSRQRSRILCNPRISTEEPWQLHSSREMLEEFISLLLLHYPDRIHMVLLVKGKGPQNFYKSKIAATRALKRSVDSLDGGVKMTFLQSASSLKTFIAETELPAIVGGPATMRGTAFDFS